MVGRKDGAVQKTLAQVNDDTVRLSSISVDRRNQYVHPHTRRHWFAYMGCMEWHVVWILYVNEEWGRMRFRSLLLLRLFYSQTAGFRLLKFHTEQLYYPYKMATATTRRHDDIFATPWAPFVVWCFVIASVLNFPRFHFNLGIELSPTCR